MFSLEIIEALEKHINRKLEVSYSRSYGAKYEENKSFELGVRSSLFVFQELVKKLKELDCREQNLQYLQAQLDAMYEEAPELQGTEYHKELVEQIEEADREVNRLSVEVYLKANQEH